MVIVKFEYLKPSYSIKRFWNCESVDGGNCRSRVGAKLWLLNLTELSCTSCVRKCFEFNGRHDWFFPFFDEGQTKAQFRFVWSSRCLYFQEFSNFTSEGGILLQQTLDQPFSITKKILFSNFSEIYKIDKFRSIINTDMRFFTSSCKRRTQRWPNARASLSYPPGHFPSSPSWWFPSFSFFSASWLLRLKHISWWHLVGASCDWCCNWNLKFTPEVPFGYFSYVSRTTGNCSVWTSIRCSIFSRTSLSLIRIRLSNFRSSDLDFFSSSKSHSISFSWALTAASFFSIARYFSSSSWK